MEMMLENPYVDFLYLLLLLFWLIYLYFVKNYGYWEQLNVPHAPAVFPLGSLSEALVFSNVNLALAYDNIYKQFQGERFCGIIEVRTPCLVIRDPELIARILDTDFDHFMDRNSFENNPKEYMMQHLFTTRGEAWREMRKKITPAYNRAKMKMIFCLLGKCSELLKARITKMVQKSEVIDVKEVLSQFTMDIVTNCIFGSDMNSLSYEKSEFYRVVPLLFQWNFSVLLKIFIYNAFPIFRKVYLKKIDLVRPEITDFLTNLIRKIVKQREENDLERFDFLDLLIKIRQNKILFEEDRRNRLHCNRPGKKESLTIEEIAGEVLAFLAGGYEKASSAITFCLYELSRNSDIQERVYEEVKEVLTRHDGVVSYQALQHMTYMDQVVSETLRLYASLPILYRSCTRDYKVPGSDLVIERGVRIVIPTFSLQRDPEYFPDPERFDPDRFRPGSSSKRHPYVYLPFGQGPRMCLGVHFGMMQIKTGLATILNGFEVSSSPGKKGPIQIKSKTFVVQPEKPLMLILKKRKSQ